MKLKSILGLYTVILIMLTGVYPLWSAYADIPKPSIDSFTPSVGWAGAQNIPESGTIVTIKGTGFDPVPEKNEVKFLDASGFHEINAKVKWGVSKGSKYEFDKTIGSPGSALGGLNHPWDVAIDNDNGDVYVVDLNNKRIQVFDKEIKPLRQFGASYLDNPWGIALDKDNVYVSDRGKGMEVPEILSSETPLEVTTPALTSPVPTLNLNENVKQPPENWYLIIGIIVTVSIIILYRSKNRR